MGGETDQFASLRRTMVDCQLRFRGVKNERVLAAMATVPREKFVPQGLLPHAYADGALPIGNEQTISQPYVVAAMTEALELPAGARVLEIGTGSGYQAAVLAQAGYAVFTVERIRQLVEPARDRLTGLGYLDIHYRTGDGYEGWPEMAPFDGILVTAAAPYVPQELVSQLATGGHLVIPVGTFSQDLLVLCKHADGSVTEKSLFPVRFVPMIHD